MVVTCPTCKMEYDDLDHSTICPHDYFPMRTLAVRGDGETKMCTSVQELNDFMKDDNYGN